MRFPIRILIPGLALFALVGCQPTKKPTAQPAMTAPPEVTPPPDSQANMEGNPEPTPPMVEPAPENEGRHVRRTSGATPRLGSLHATYNARAGTLTVVVLDKILFATGSTKLKAEAHATLDRIASTIRREYPGHRVYVDGHTDSTPIRSGRWANNHELAADRALAVAEYLMKHGIHENDLVVRSYGAINPRSSREASRRVEIVVVVR
jgi:type VI secretion system protein ImpK